MGLFRTVGKIYNRARTVGKQLHTYKQMLGKVTNGASDQMIDYGYKKMMQMAEDKIPNFNLVKDTYNTGKQVVNQVRGGRYDDAAVNRHRFAKRNHSGYRDAYGRVTGTMDRYGITDSVKHIHNQVTRPYMRRY